MYDSPAIIFFCCDSDKFGFVSLPLEQHSGGRNLGESIKLALPFRISISFLVLLQTNVPQEKECIFLHTSTGFKVKSETAPSKHCDHFCVVFFRLNLDKNWETDDPNIVHSRNVSSVSEVSFIGVAQPTGINSHFLHLRFFASSLFILSYLGCTSLAASLNKP